MQVIWMVYWCREPQQRHEREQQRPVPDRVGGAEVPGAQHLLWDALLHGARGHAADAGGELPCLDLRRNHHETIFMMQFIISDGCDWHDQPCAVPLGRRALFSLASAPALYLLFSET